MPKTKIICTLGPAVDTPETLKKLMQAGMNVARMNFSHGDETEHLERVELFKRVRAELGLHIPLLLDTKGPEIRLETFRDGSVQLADGGSFTLHCRPFEGDETGVSITYSQLDRDVRVGQSILIDDGLIELRVERIADARIECTVVNGGTVSNRKGINVPGAQLGLPAMTEQDEADIRFGIENDFDFIALSFVRKARDVREVRRLLEANGGGDIKIIAKIENQEGVDNAEEIIRASDGIMVARGDLGVEIPAEQVPGVQKNLIRRGIAMGRVVIIATQMLDSMIRNPRPTRAEVSDVANAVYDGTSCIMLSGETANGKYPIESLETMVRIAATAEAATDYWSLFRETTIDTSATVTDAISHATCNVAMDLGATAIVTVTQSGTTARMISRFRPQVPILATTPSKKTLRQLGMSWGVTAMLLDEVDSTDALFSASVNEALQQGFLREGDVTVVTAGVPIGMSGTTNILKVQIAGNILLTGRGVSPGSATGELFMFHPGEDAGFQSEKIIVAEHYIDEMMPLLRQSRALILESNDTAGLASTAGRALDIPVIAGALGATKLLHAGTVVRVDADAGLVSHGE